jgi:hypothetical protein
MSNLNHLRCQSVIIDPDLEATQGQFGVLHDTTTHSELNREQKVKITKLKIKLKNTEITKITKITKKQNGKRNLK